MEPFFTEQNASFNSFVNEFLASIFITIKSAHKDDGKGLCSNVVPVGEFEWLKNVGRDLLKVTVGTLERLEHLFQYELAVSLVNSQQHPVCDIFYRVVFAMTPVATSQP